MKTPIVHIHRKEGGSRAGLVFSATPRMAAATLRRGWPPVYVYLILSPHLPRAPAMGMMQAVPGGTVITPRYRCPKAGAYRRASPKSVGEREQVSLSPALSSRPDCHTGSRACGGRSDSLSSSTPKATVMASCPSPLSRGFCACIIVYSVFKDQM